MIAKLLVLLAVCYLSEGHGFFSGYRSGRTWSTGGSKRSRGMTSRMGRQHEDLSTNSLEAAPEPEECSPCTSTSIKSGPVCATDGKTYTSACQVQQLACKAIRRQGRSFQNSQLRLEVSKPGPCVAPCEGMEEFGQFHAFGIKATNAGLCIHDFFRCASALRGHAMPNYKIESCCQVRFDQCSRA